MPTILITDSLFFFKEHEQQLQAAGYDFERLDKPDATEEELIAAIKGKSRVSVWPHRTSYSKSD